MRFFRFVGLGWGESWRGVIFAVHHKNLANLVSQSERFFPLFGMNGKFLGSAGNYYWRWRSGEHLYFRHAADARAHEDFLGHEYPFIGFDELTRWASGDLYDLMTGCNRTSGPSHCEVFSTTNPSGVGNPWVRRRFINPAPIGTLFKERITWYDPLENREETESISHIAIPGAWWENPHLPKTYLAFLHSLRTKDPMLYKAWVLGSWDVTTGGALNDLWDSQVHVIPHFRVPDNWYVDRAFDWGSGHPFSVGWFAMANGETVRDGDKEYQFPAGTLIQIEELYGAQGSFKNKGLGWSATRVAQAIRQKENKIMAEGIYRGRIRAGPADNSISNKQEADTATIEELMRRQGVTWTRSDKSKGARRIGLQLLRDRLDNAKRKEGPGLYFMHRCRNSVEFLPGMERSKLDREDVDTNSEDHIYDMVRYRALVHRSSSKLTSHHVSFSY